VYVEPREIIIGEGLPVYLTLPSTTFMVIEVLGVTRNLHTKLKIHCA